LTGSQNWPRSGFPCPNAVRCATSAQRGDNVKEKDGKKPKDSDRTRVAAGVDATQILKAVLENDRIMREAMGKYKKDND
jgi:hypothetical protein